MGTKEFVTFLLLENVERDFFVIDLKQLSNLLNWSQSSKPIHYY